MAKNVCRIRRTGVKQMTNRTQQAEETKTRILHAAQRLIAEKGIEKTTIKDIAQAAGVAVGTFYCHFKSKGEIVLGIDRNPYEQLTRYIQEMENYTFGQKLYAYFTNWYKIGETYGPRFLREWYRLALDIEKYTDMTGMAPKIVMERDALVLLLQQGVSEGELNPDTPVEDISCLLACELQGTSMYWCFMDGTVPREKIVRDFITYVAEPVLEKHGLKTPLLPR